MSRAHLLGPLTLRPTSAGAWWALDRRETGWASYGYPFDYLGDALDAFDAKLTGCGRDRFGLYLIAECKSK
jgi:hypothetical protein